MSFWSAGLGLLSGLARGRGETKVVVTNNSLFGDPLPASETLPGVAAAKRAAVTWAGVALGFCPKNTAAAPLTCGVAMDVPEIVFVALLLVFHAEVISVPGA